MCINMCVGVNINKRGCSCLVSFPLRRFLSNCDVIHEAFWGVGENISFDCNSWACCCERLRCCRCQPVTVGCLSTECPTGCSLCTTDDTTATCKDNGCIAEGYTQVITKTCVGQFTNSITDIFFFFFFFFIFMPLLCGVDMGR